MFPDAIEIVDTCNAKQHLCDVAKAIYGPGTDLATGGPRTGVTNSTPADCAPSSPRDTEGRH